MLVQEQGIHPLYVIYINLRALGGGGEGVILLSHSRLQGQTFLFLQVSAAAVISWMA